MTPTEQDYARRLREHPRFRWMRGMCALTAGHPRDEFRVTYPEGLREASDLATCVPDLADPATLGCLIAMLSDDLDYIVPAPPGGRWHVELLTSHGPGTCPTLGEALARALMAAWGEA